MLQEQYLAEFYEQRLQEMDSYTKKVNYLKREFDDDLVRRLHQTVSVISESKVEIQFQSGIVIRQDVLCAD
ncbi:hypothetical protein [Proteiniborus sp. MB09-C3]|uniref:hypothetical protein n=1 Tax=Proteiniborus sp. MB09-C3 TaxID=3050072 RepID=UPI002555F116|nr:hypothetical protein [Proteiniborus sp. MB09-C3]WIV13674.1 hypothetical protein QO263_08245 [Proteiniborus sp. MB09-C3]